MVEIVDLPGIYDLHGFSDDERSSVNCSRRGRSISSPIVINAVQIDRQLALAMQLRAARATAVLLLNMADEAKQLRHPHRHERMARAPAHAGRR